MQFAIANIKPPIEKRMTWNMDENASPVNFETLRLLNVSFR